MLSRVLHAPSLRPNQNRIVGLLLILHEEAEKMPYSWTFFHILTIHGYPSLSAELGSYIRTSPKPFGGAASFLADVCHAVLESYSIALYNLTSQGC
jgi:hypothetical protein